MVLSIQNVGCLTIVETMRWRFERVGWRWQLTRK